MVLSLRFNRKNATAFLFVEATETFAAGKAKVRALAGTGAAAARLFLHAAD